MKIKVFYLTIIAISLFTVSCGSKKEDVKPVNNFVAENNLEYIKSVADEYVFARDGFKDYNMTIPVTDGSQILTMKSKSTALFCGKFTYMDDKDATFGVNVAPSQPEGGYPKYHASEGGFLHMYNGLNISYSMLNNLDDLPAVGEFYYVCRLYLTTNYESIMSGYGAPELKVWGDTKKFQFSNGDYKTPNQYFNASLDTMRTVVYRFLYKDNKVSIFVTDKDGDNRELGTLNISAASFFRKFAIGTSSHPMTHDFFGYIMKFGSFFSETESENIIKTLKANYPIGKRPDKSLVFPSISSSGSVFKVDLKFVPNPSKPSATLDSTKSIIRWYHFDNINAPTGNGIDRQSIIKTSNCKASNLKIDISTPEFSSLFPKVGGKKNGVAVDVTVIDSNGDSFVIPLTSYPQNNLY